MNEFYERVLSDEELRPFFEDVDMHEQRGHQTRFLVTAIGGPKLYDGDDMEEAHDHLDVGQSISVESRCIWQTRCGSLT